MKIADWRHHGYGMHEGSSPEKKKEKRKNKNEKNKRKIRKMRKIEKQNSSGTDTPVHPRGLRSMRVVGVFTSQV